MELSKRLAIPMRKLRSPKQEKYCPRLVAERIEFSAFLIFSTLLVAVS